MSKYQFFMFLILLFSSTICFSSEQVSIRGIVIDEETQSPVSGLNIVLGYYTRKWFFSISPDFITIDNIKSSKDGTFELGGKIPKRFVILIKDDICWKHTEQSFSLSQVDQSLVVNIITKRMSFDFCK